MSGFKRGVVLGLAASALVLAAGCRDEPRNGLREGEAPADLRQLPEQEGFQSVPEAQEAPSGIGLDGRGNGDERPRD